MPGMTWRKEEVATAASTSMQLAGGDATYEQEPRGHSSANSTSQFVALRMLMANVSEKLRLVTRKSTDCANYWTALSSTKDASTNPGSTCFSSLLLVVFRHVASPPKLSAISESLEETEEEKPMKRPFGEGWKKRLLIARPQPRVQPMVSAAPFKPSEEDVRFGKALLSFCRNGLSRTILSLSIMKFSRWIIELWRCWKKRGLPGLLLCHCQRRGDWRRTRIELNRMRLGLCSFLDVYLLQIR